MPIWIISSLRQDRCTVGSPDSDQEDVALACAAAKAAFPAWSRTSLEERYRILIRISELIDHHLEELAEAESRDNGKPVWLAKKVDIPGRPPIFDFMPPD